MNRFLRSCLLQSSGARRYMSDTGRTKSNVDEFGGGIILNKDFPVTGPTQIQMQKMKNYIIKELAFHQEQIKRHEDAIRRHHEQLDFINSTAQQ